MNRKLAVVFFMIVLIPLALLIWLGQRVARTEEARLERQFENLTHERLARIDAQLQVFLSSIEKDLADLTVAMPRDPDELRQRVRDDARLACLFRLDPTGMRTYPLETEERPLTRAEALFLNRTRLIWDDKVLLHLSESDLENRPARSRPSTTSSMSDEPQPSISGWYAWHFEHGLHLLYWRQLNTGEIVGAELDRSRFMSDLIAALPDASEASADGGGVTALRGSDLEVIYQWGPSVEDLSAPARVTHALSAPLQAWQLAWVGSPASPVVTSSRFLMIVSATTLFLVLAVMVAYFYRESSRELREAAQRVNFVGQVSHELKTPLTNIRMYAELLERELPEEDAEARKDLDVIVSESRRLTRLIGNILTFSRKDREKLQLRLSRGNLDEAIRNTVEHFRPLLESKGVHLELDLHASEEISLDQDIVEQIVGNLLSNVEKYGATGGELAIRSKREGNRSVVSIMDRGPGIPLSEREKVFEPFYRISDRLTDGVAGTGLGLALSRDLARLHGGDLRILDSDAGAHFELTLDHSEALEGAET